MSTTLPSLKRNTTRQLPETRTLYWPARSPCKGCNRNPGAHWRCTDVSPLAIGTGCAEDMVPERRTTARVQRPQPYAPDLHNLTDVASPQQRGRGCCIPAASSFTARFGVVNLSNYVPTPAITVEDELGVRWTVGGRVLTTDELRALIRNHESDRVELTASKSNTDKFGQAICAFANDFPSHERPGYLIIGMGIIYQSAQP